MCLPLVEEEAEAWDTEDSWGNSAQEEEKEISATDAMIDYPATGVRITVVSEVCMGGHWSP